jgi:hypothetical protein
VNTKNLAVSFEDGKFLYFSLAITALFVIFEAKYNIDLLNTLSNPDATSDVVDSLSQRGKILASLGITWAFGRVLITRIRPAILGLAAFFGCAILIYFGLDFTYTKVIADLPSQVKVEGFNLFSYRRDLLTGKLSDPDIPLPRENPVEGKIVMGSFPIVLLDDRFMLPAQDIVARKAIDKSNHVLHGAAAKWPSYAKQMADLNNSYEQYIKGSRQAYQYKAFGGIEKFRQRSGGLDPNPGLNRMQFIAMLRSGNHPRGKELQAAEAREIGKRVDGSVLYARDLPYFMDRHEYMRWFEIQAEQAKVAAMPTIETVETFKGIRDINSAVFLPPMAIISSLMSALTNAVTLLLMLIGIGLGAVPGCKTIGVWIKRWVVPLMFVAVTCILFLMPSHVFRAETPLYDLETLMHEKVGFAGKLWSRLSGIHAKLL